MIITAVLKLIVGVLSFVVGLIPSLDFGFDIASYIAPVAQVLSYVDYFVSVPAILMSIAAIIVVDNFEVMLKIFSWLYDKIPFL